MKPTIQQVIDFYNFDTKLNCNDQIQKCCFPDHDDSTASLMYYSKTDSFYCFGCHRGGDSYQFAFEYFKSIGEEKSLGSILKDFNQDSYNENKEINFLDKLILSLDEVEENIDDYYLRCINLIRDFLTETDESQIKVTDRLYYELDKYYATNNIEEIKKTLSKLPLFLASKKAVFREQNIVESKKEFKPGLIDISQYLFSDTKKKNMLKYLREEYFNEYYEISKGKFNSDKVKQITKELIDLVTNNITYYQQVSNTNYENKIIKIEMIWGKDTSWDYEMLIRQRSKNIPLHEMQFKLIDKRYEYIEEKQLVNFDYLFPGSSNKVNFRKFKSS